MKITNSLSGSTGPLIFWNVFPRVKMFLVHQIRDSRSEIFCELLRDFNKKTEYFLIYLKKGAFPELLSC